MKRFFLMVAAVLSFAALDNAPGIAGSESFAPGEVLTYTIRKFGVKAGEAVIEYRGLVDLEGQQKILITFVAKGFNFLDDEKIFADPETLLPVRVERELNIFGKRERIVEFYDIEKKTVTIKKYDNDAVIEEIVFKKEEPIDNLYCYIFRYRQSGLFKEGEAFRMPLPTKDVDFKIIRQERVAALQDRQNAWYMQSQPPEYHVWFSQDPRKIPLRIDGGGGLAKTVMVLESYEQTIIE